VTGGDTKLATAVISHHDEMDVFDIKAIGIVRGGRDVPEDDNWEGSSAEIELDSNQFNAEALLGLDQFSHSEIVFVFNQVRPDDITYDAHHTRGRTDWPKVSIFAQRGRNRPNRIGVSGCRIAQVSGLLCVCRVWMLSMGPPTKVELSLISRTRSLVKLIGLSANGANVRFWRLSK
jgi:tRNA (Thr-GGU) A37 N-methylase